MSRRPRRNRAPGFTAKVALAALGRAGRSLAQLAEQFDVQPNQITPRRATAQGRGCRNAFGSGCGSGGVQPAFDVKSLHAKIRELTSGERFFEKSARQSRFVECKAMLDREHDLPISQAGTGSAHRPWQ